MPRYAQSRFRRVRRTPSSKTPKIPIDDVLHALCIKASGALGLRFEVFIAEALAAEVARPGSQKANIDGDEGLAKTLYRPMREVSVSEDLRADCVLAAQAAGIDLGQLVADALKARLAKADRQIKQARYLKACNEAEERNDPVTPQPWEFGLV